MPNKRLVLLIAAFLAIIIIVLIIVLQPKPGDSPNRASTSSTGSVPPAQNELKIQYPAVFMGVDTNAFDISVSPNNARVAFARYNEDDASYSLCWSDSNAETAAEIVRTKEGKPVYPRWNESGQYLAYAVVEKRQTMVYIYDVINTQFITPGGLSCADSLFFKSTASSDYLSDFLYKESLSEPFTWSKNDLLIITNPAKIYDTAQKKLLLDASANGYYEQCLNATLSPKGDKLAFMGYGRDYIDYVVTDLSTGESKAIYQRKADTVFGVEYLSWYDNIRLAIDINDTAPELCLLNINDSSLSAVYQYSSSAGGYCRLSADGKYLLIVDIVWRNTRDISIICLCDTQTGRVSELFTSDKLIFTFGDNADTIIGINEKGASIRNLAGKSLGNYTGQFFGALPQIDKGYRLLINFRSENSPPIAAEYDPDPLPSIPSAPPSLQDAVYRTAQSFVSALQAGNTEIIELLSRASSSTYADWENMRVTSSELEMMDQEEAYGRFKLKLNIAESGVPFFPAGNQTYEFIVTRPPEGGEIIVSSIYPENAAPIIPGDTAETAKEAATALTFDFFNYMGELAFSSAADLPKEVILDFAIIRLAKESGMTAGAFSPAEINNKIAAMFGILNFDGTDTYLYDQDTKSYPFYARGGYTGAFRMPEDKIVYDPDSHIFTAEIWLFADPLQTRTSSRLLYTLNAGAGGVSLISVAFISNGES